VVARMFPLLPADAAPPEEPGRPPA
jgi:hypothetical protein